MNGDADKLPAGAVFPSSSDPSLTTIEQPTQQPLSALSTTAVGTAITPPQNQSLQSTSNQFGSSRVPARPQTENIEFASSRTRGIGDTTEFGNTNGAMSGSSSDGAADAAYPDSNASGDGAYMESNNIPLDQLKQMLSTQLEYYFSR